METRQPIWTTTMLDALPAPASNIRNRFGPGCPVSIQVENCPALTEAVTVEKFVHVVPWRRWTCSDVPGAAPAYVPVRLTRW